MALQNTNSDQRIDKELKDIFLSSGKMDTSPDFTQNIMSLIEKEAAVNAINYKPLISTGGWIGIAVFILVIFLTALSYGSDPTGQRSEIFQHINNFLNLKTSINILTTTTSRIGEYLLSSSLFISLAGLMGLGVVFSFFYLKIEGLRKNHLYQS